MDKFYNWQPEYTNAFLTILSVSIGFIIYWFLSVSEQIKSFFLKKYETRTGWINYIFFQKMMGFFFIGFIPSVLLLSISQYALADLGLKPGNFKESLFYIGGGGIIICFLNYFGTKKPTSLAIYPQMRINEWSLKPLIINTLGWIAYIFAYEFAFRGLLLIVCFDSFGFWPAVAINLSFYSATHIAKGLAETVGTFPYGFLLCFVTISTGSIAFAFISHLILALTNDYFSIHHSREMKYV